MCIRLLPIGLQPKVVLPFPISVCMIIIITGLYIAKCTKRHMSNNLELCTVLINACFVIYTFILVKADNFYGQHFILFRQFWLGSYWCQGIGLVLLFGLIVWSCGIYNNSCCYNCWAFCCYCHSFQIPDIKSAHSYLYQRDYNINVSNHSHSQF